MFEHHRQPLISGPAFALRIGRCAAIAFILISVTVACAAVAYHFIEKMSWIDAVLNAVMIMTGLGLTTNLQTPLAKIFTSFYAVLSSVVFFAVLGILFAPLIHRFFHRFHLDIDKK